MVNKENVKKWLEALRSGEYQQGKRKLFTEEGNFCCLGVACDMYAKEELQAPTAKGNRQDWYENISLACGHPTYELYGDELLKGEIKMIGYDTDCDETLPDAVADWLGVPTMLNVTVEGGRLDGSKEGVTFLNDTENKTFEEIADLLEKEFLNG